MLVVVIQLKSGPSENCMGSLECSSGFHGHPHSTPPALTGARPGKSKRAMLAMSRAS